MGGYVCVLSEDNYFYSTVKIHCESHAWLFTKLTIGKKGKKSGRKIILKGKMEFVKYCKDEIFHNNNNVKEITKGTIVMTIANTLDYSITQHQL